MGYMTEKTGRCWYATFQKKCWDVEFQQFLKEKNEAIDWEAEWSGADYEQAILVQMIFGELLKKKFNVKEFKVWSYYSICMLEDNEEMLIYYDVMNTNKQDKSFTERMHPSGKCHLYHSLGNYAIYPRMERRSLQFIHRDYNEKWDKFLMFLKDNWYGIDVKYRNDEKEYTYQQKQSFKEKWAGLEFEDYMKLTCQHMYYKEVFEQLDAKKIKNMTDKEIAKLLEELDALDLRDAKLLSINDADIEFLITIRERFILARLYSEDDSKKADR